MPWNAVDCRADRRRLRSLPTVTDTDRLDSWKEIAAYMRRDVTTVQRWEKREGMPVHRHLHDKTGSVYAFKAELDGWAGTRRQTLATEPDVEPVAPAPSLAPQPPPVGFQSRSAWPLAATVAIVAVAALAIWQFRKTDRPSENPLSDATFQALTDFDGIEQAAAVSRDGRFVAFLSDRDGQMDVWVTQPGVGQFYNLTRGSIPDLVNPSVRTLGFSPDGTLVTFWARRPDASGQPSISTWAVPVLGGQARPYLEGAAEFDWSADGSRLVYHTPGPGDPMFVRSASPGSEATQIFSAPAGLHSHFPIWSPDQAFIYFVQGTLPDRLDIWRIRPAGGTPERITSHDAFVSHPVFAGPRTLVYLASNRDGSGPWIHTVDVEERVPRRASSGVERYTSLSASADGRRVVATLANPKGTLWRLPVTGTRADMAAASRIPLTTGSGSSPRLSATYMLYVSSRGSGDSIWKLQGDASSEVWGAADARIVGGPAMARDGKRLAFLIRQKNQTLLYTVNADGTQARSVATGFEFQGAPAWSPGDAALTVAAIIEGTPRLFNVPLDGSTPVPLVHDYSVDPVWSPDGAFVAFSGPDIGTTFEVKAVKPDGTPFDLRKITLTRGGRHVTLMPGRRSMVILKGAIRHKNIWLVDLETGAEQQLTDLPPEFEVRDFDISPDGREIVLERVQEHSDLMMIDLRPRTR